MWVRVLGPVGVGDAANAAFPPLGSRSQRLILAVLAARGGETVSADVLVDALWGDEPPRTADHTLRTYVSRLRSVLGDALSIAPGGYALVLGSDQLDAARFELLTAEAQKTADPAAAAQRFDEALGLWSGPAFGELADIGALRGAALRLEELRLAAVEARARALLRAGDPASAVAAAEELLAAHPLREGAWAVLVEALVERHAAGEPTGLLIERAWSQAHAASAAAYLDPDRWEEHLLARMRVLLSEGITCIHDAATPPAAEALYRRVAAAGRLPFSVLTMPHPAALLSGPEGDRLDGPPTGDGDEWLRVGPVKLFADGGSHPAIDAHRHGERFTAGIAFPDLAADTARVADRGFRVAVHAMGNVGLESTLDAFAGVARRDDSDQRFRVEHATLASPVQLTRLAELGGVAVVQPGFLPQLGARVSSLGFDDATWMPFADLVRAGVPIAASSDHPCGDWQPLAVSCHGATRWTGREVFGADQALAYEDWLRAWTAGSAFAGGQEHERGRLIPGLRADLVILDGALDHDHPPTVSETWVAGRRCYAV